MTRHAGIVFLVGAGPGDPGLITVRGLELLRCADAVVHDRLVPGELLVRAARDAEVIDVGKSAGDHRRQQKDINELLVRLARQGKVVVRLKGGDPFVFGRGFEELEHCRRAGVACVVIPGVTSALAGPASAGIPVTMRQVARSVAMVTASTAGEGDAPALDYAALARLDTVVVLMGHRHLAAICASLLEAGMSEDMPAACIERATTPAQRVARGTLAGIAREVARQGLGAPLITIFGEVAVAGGGSGLAHSGLAGKRVVVTRPASRQAGVAKLLRRAGAEPIACPVTRIEYEGDTAGLLEAVQRLAAYDWLAFTSAHGVRGFSRVLRKHGLDSRALSNCRVAAIGRATSRALHRVGIAADVVGKGGAGALAEAILAASATPPSRVLFPCGDHRRDELIDGLKRAGSVVEAIAVYRAHPVAVTDEAKSALKLGFDAVLFYSPSAVTNFAAVFDAGDTVAACIGESTAHAARRAGFDRVMTSAETTDEAMLNVLVRHFDETEVPA